MNEKLQYAEMLGIPVSTSSVTYRPIKKSRRTKKVDADKVKDELINKINSTEDDQLVQTNQTLNKAEAEIMGDDNSQKDYTPKNKFKLTLIGIQMIIIGLLVATIFITNALVPDSGINVFMRNVFSADEVANDVDLRTHKDFDVVLPVSLSGGVVSENGGLNIEMTGSLYCPVDGIVTDLTFDKETEKYIVEITHNDNFKTVFGGLDYAYSEIGSKVYSNIPVGYVMESATMCFIDGNDAVITDYVLTDNQVVWEV